MKKINAFLVLMLLLSVRSFAQIANASCNADSTTPFISANFDGLQVSSSKTLLGGNEFNNLGNQTDSNLTNYSTSGGFIGVDSWIRTTDTNSVYPAGTFAGYDFNIVNVAIINFGTVTVSTYKAGVQQESKSYSANSVVDLGTKLRAGFKTTKEFDAIQLRYQSATLGIPAINVYNPVIIRFCQSANLVCNTMTAMTRPAFAAFVNAERTGTSGLTLGTVTNADDAVDSNTNSYAALTNVANIAGSTFLSVEDGSTTYPGGTFAGFDVENANLVSISAFNSVTIKTYLNGTLQEQKTGSSLWIGAPIFDFQNRFVIGMETTKSFDEVQIVMNQPLNFNLGTTKVFSAVLKKPCEPAPLACNTPTAVTEPNFPVNINSERTGVSGLFSFGFQVTEPDNVLDANPSNYASITVPATIGTSGSLSVLKSLADYPVGTYAGFDIQATSLVNTEFLKNITLKSYKDGVLQETISGNGILLGANSDLVASSGRSVLGFVSKKAFDELQISVNNVLGVDLGTTRVYKMVAMKPCQKEISCKNSYYLNQPEFPVVLNAQRTGLKTLACAGCSVNNPDNVIDANPNNYARITLASGIGNAGSISVLDPTATYPKGTFAGFTVKDRYFLVQGDLLEFITVKTYLHGVLQESKTSTDLVDLTLLIPIWGTGTKNVGFYTTKDFDEVQIETVSVASLINILDIYGAYIDTRSSNGGSLNCAVAIDAVNDSLTTNPGGATTNVLANDTVLGQPATLSNVTLTQVSSTNAGVALNPNGTISVATGTPAGTYTVHYKICATANNNLSCDEADAVVTVKNALVANPEVFANITTTSGGTTTTSVLANDTINGAAVSTNTVTLTPGTLPAGFTMNADGTLTVAPNTPAGVYGIPYTICDKADANNCATTTSTITLVAPSVVIVANGDSISANTGSVTTGNILANDTVNNLPAVVGAVTVIPGNMPAGINVDAATGIVTVDDSVATGSYTFNYTLKDNATNTVSAPATVTVTVTGIINLRALIGASAPTLVTDVSVQLIYRIQSVGSAPTKGAVIVRLFKPFQTVGIFTELKMPAGWNMTANTADYYEYSSTNVINPKEEIVFAYSFTKKDNTIGNLTIRTQIVNGSGGDSVNTDNTALVTLNKIN